LYNWRSGDEDYSNYDEHILNNLAGVKLNEACDDDSGWRRRRGCLEKKRTFLLELDIILIDIDNLV